MCIRDSASPAPVQAPLFGGSALLSVTPCPPLGRVAFPPSRPTNRNLAVRWFSSVCKPRSGPSSPVRRLGASANKKPRRPNRPPWFTSAHIKYEDRSLANRLWAGKITAKVIAVIAVSITDVSAHRMRSSLCLVVRTLLLFGAKVKHFFNPPSGPACRWRRRRAPAPDIFCRTVMSAAPFSGHSFNLSSAFSRFFSLNP